MLSLETLPSCKLLFIPKANENQDIRDETPRMSRFATLFTIASQCVTRLKRGGLNWKEDVQIVSV